VKNKIAFIKMQRPVEFGGAFFFCQNFAKKIFLITQNAPMRIKSFYESKAIL